MIMRQRNSLERTVVRNFMLDPNRESGIHMVVKTERIADDFLFFSTTDCFVAVVVPQTFLHSYSVSTKKNNDDVYIFYAFVRLTNPCN